MTESFEDLEATYGPSAPYSEHKRGERITYTSADGERRSAEIVWVQAPFQDIGIKYVVAPDEEGQFLDFVLPADVISQDVTQEQEQTLVRCVWCGHMHPATQLEQCPLKPQ